MNRYAATPQALPLRPVHLFQATPADVTLSRLLGRWADEAGLVLAYQPATDYSLHQDVAAIRAADLDTALSRLAAAYAAQGLVLVREGGRLVASIGPVAPAAPASAAAGVPARSGTTTPSTADPRRDCRRRRDCHRAGRS